MSEHALTVEAKDLLPGSIVALPAPTTGAAVESQAEVLEVLRTVRRKVAANNKITEEDTTTLHLRILPLRAVSFRDYPSAHSFFLVGRAHQ